MGATKSFGIIVVLGRKLIIQVELLVCNGPYCVGPGHNRYDWRLCRAFLALNSKKALTMSNSPWQIHKFGGSSLTDAACFRRVAEILLSADRRPQVAVVSAMRGMTDALLALIRSAELADDRGLWAVGAALAGLRGTPPTPLVAVVDPYITRVVVPGVGDRTPRGWTLSEKLVDVWEVPTSAISARYVGQAAATVPGLVRIGGDTEEVR